VAAPEMLRFAKVISLILKHYPEKLEPRSLMSAATRGMLKKANIRIDSRPDLNIEAFKNNPLPPGLLDGLVEFSYYFDRARSMPRAPVTRQLFRYAIEAAIESLDPYSRLIKAEEVQAAAGMGAAAGLELQKRRDKVMVVGTVKNSPAALIGMRPGDMLLAVGDTPVTGLALLKIVKLLRGKAGSITTLTFIRDAEKYTAQIKRQSISQLGVDSILFDDRIAYLKVKRFTKATARSMLLHLRSMDRQADIRGIIVDLRHNSGGALSGVVAATDLFLSEGLILQTRGRGEAENLRFMATSDANIVAPNIPMVILVNGQTASGAEAMAAALQDHARATILGSSTFGQGSVQTLFPLQGGDLLKITTAHIWRANGSLLDRTAVVPDICVDPSGRMYFVDVKRIATKTAARRACPTLEILYGDESEDRELFAAIEILRGRKYMAQQ